MSSSSAINRLSPELLHGIFLLLDSPAAFAQVQRSWHAISQDSYSVSQHLLAHHPKHEVLSAAISYGHVATPKVIELLLAAGGIFSRYLAVALQLRWFASPLRCISWITEGEKWGMQGHLGVTTFARLMELAEARWGTLPRDTRALAEVAGWEAWHLSAMAVHGMLVNERAESASLALNALPHGMASLRQNLELLWEQLALLVERFSFVPFHLDDPLYLTLAQGVLLEPRLLPLLQRNGWDYTTAVNDQVARSLLSTKDPPVAQDGVVVRNGQLAIEPRAEIIATLLEDFIRIPGSPFYISATVAGEVEALSGGSNGPSPFVTDARYALLCLENARVLDFSLADIRSDLVHLLHNTRSFVLQPISTTVLLARWPELGITCRTGATQWEEDPTAASLARFCSQILNSAVTKDKQATRALAGPLEKMDMVPDRLDSRPMGFGEGCWTEEYLAAVAVEHLCNEFLYSPEELLLEEVEKGTDVLEVVARAAKRMVRIPCKGTTLLALATRFPFLVAIIEAEVLLHRISFPLLPPTCAVDPSRPIFNHRPAFLSPIAFDYAGAQERYSLGLGPHPWVENFYEQGPPPVVNPSYASSVWPVKPSVYTKQVGKDVLDRGFVTGSKLARTVGVVTREERRGEFELVAWTAERVPLGSLPVAIALLDLFDKDSQVLDIVFMHAQLNMNPQVASFYLQEGVPLRDHHLEALSRLNLPRLKVVEDYLAARDSGVALSTKTSLTRGRRMERKKAKAEALVVIV